MKALILGSKSEIASDLQIRLMDDGWAVRGWHRGSKSLPQSKWNLCLIAIGQVAPVGYWWELGDEFNECVYSNVLTPLSLLKRVWGLREKAATVCFFAGSNPQKPMAGYSAYNLGKMGLLKLVEQLDMETPDAKFVALAPGYVPTKIHRATIEKGWQNERIDRGGGTPLPEIYKTLKWIIKQPKEVVGGRNICVSDIRPDLDKRLKENLSMFKLRRVE
jgi:NAD(P)-dependent dehydrogenase (short-subunit alcohol dehydrogenase family)